MASGVVLSRRLNRRLLAGFVVVPPVIGALTFVTFLVLLSADALSYARGVEPLDAAASVGLAVGLLAALVTVAGALPAVLWLARRGPFSLRTLLGLGALLGNAPLALIIAVATTVNVAAGTVERGRDLYDPARALARVAAGLACGMAGAAVFWLIAVRGSELDTSRPME